MKQLLLKISLIIISSSLLASCVPAVVASTAGVLTSIGEVRTIGDKLDDNLIVVKAKEKFAEENVNQLLARISVNAYEGRVLLTGSVHDKSIIKQAEEIIWKIEGVREVINELKVDNRAFRDFTKESFIANAARSKLLVEENVASNNYIIDVSKTTVYIIGVARDSGELDKVINVVSKIKGVTEVISHVILQGDTRRYE